MALSFMITNPKTYADRLPSKLLNMLDFLKKSPKPALLARILNKLLGKSNADKTADKKEDEVMTLFSSQPNEEGTTNVVSLWQNRAKTSTADLSKKSEAYDAVFSEMMQKNASNQQRLKQERLKANQQVLRSYRIKK